MPTFGSLFAGVGGFDLGFEAAGWECRWQVEWDARCRSVLARHWPDVPRYGDVADVDGLAPVDCITYGFPCQDLSVAGNRAGLDGERSGLFFQATRIIREMREATDGRHPTWAVAENVPGLLSADGGDAMGRVLDELADCGAVGVEWATLDAQHFGVPQRRRRVFVVAWFDPRIGSTDPLLPVSARCARHPGPGGTSGPEPARTVGPGTSGGAFVKAKRAMSDTDDETWTEGVAPTLNAFDNGSESRATVLAFQGGAQQDWIGTPAAVAPTLAHSSNTHDGNHQPKVALSAGVRRLTPRECERLQGWPDDHTRWDADGNELPDSFRYRACGNGVAAPVAEWIATRLQEAAN